MRPHLSDHRHALQINHPDLVMVMGQIAHPVGAATPYRIGHDGVPRVLPATGGIVINKRIGDRCGTSIRQVLCHDSAVGRALGGWYRRLVTACAGGARSHLRRG